MMARRLGKLLASPGPLPQQRREPGRPSAVTFEMPVLLLGQVAASFLMQGNQWEGERRVGSFSFSADKEDVPMLVGVGVSAGRAVVLGTQVAFRACEACLSVAVALVFPGEKAVFSQVQVGCFSPVPLPSSSTRQGWGAQSTRVSVMLRALPCTLRDLWCSREQSGSDHERR